jgi:CRP-like cAMP-binding protein
MSLNSFDVKKYYFKNGSSLNKLSAKAKKSLDLHSKLLVEKKNKILFKEEQYSKGFYFLLKGKIIFYQTASDGKEQIVYIYSDNEALGYRPILCQSKHPATAKLIEDSMIRFIPKENFLTLLNSSTEIANAFLQMLSYEFNIWVNKTAAFAQKPVKARLALALLILNEIYKKNNQDTQPAITLSRMHMARYISSSLETLVRMLRVFNDEKLILLEGKKIFIKEFKKIKLLALS